MQQGTVGMDCKKLCFHFGKKYFVFLLYFKQEFMYLVLFQITLNLLIVI